MTPIEIVLKHFGSPSETAAALGVKPMTVSQWIRRNRIPLVHAVNIEIVTCGVIAKEMVRPDVFRNSRATKARKSA
jgi:DNA-binding transcriptional regulator YdaS (Cro superfamily)